MTLTNQQFRKLLTDAIEERKAHDRAARGVRLLKEGYRDEDELEDYETGGLYGDQKTLREPSKTDNPYGYNLISDWVPEKLAAKGREDALAGEPMNPLYTLDAKYDGDSIEDREFKQDKAAYYRDAYKKALAARTAPMSRKSLEEGSGIKQRNSRNGLEEDASAMNLVLDIAGLIPGAGEFADLANAVDYARKGDYLFSALSLISVIPGIGDLVGKGGKVAIILSKLGKGGTKAAKALDKVTKGEKFAKTSEFIVKLQTVLYANEALIDLLFEKAEDIENEELQKYLPKIKEALDIFIRDAKSADDTEIEDTEGEPDEFGAPEESSDDMSALTEDKAAYAKWKRLII